MIDFEGYYSFAPEQVESVEADTRTDETGYPFTLSVWLKSGRKLSVNYATKKGRDNAKRLLENNIEIALRRDTERLQSQLSYMEDVIRRIDKRQLRIWRQLKAILQLTASEDEEE